MNNTIAFLGDSLTEWGPWAELLPEYPILNYGIRANKTDDLLARLEAVCQQKARRIFLMVGVNDLGERRPLPLIVANYRRIVQRLLHSNPQMELWCISVLPIHKGMFAHTQLEPLHIPLLNAQLQQLALEQGCGFLNFYDAFVDEHGRLNEAYTYDGLHLNTAGYLLWRQLLLPCLQQNKWEGILTL